jgi:hypothetical protein
MDSVVLLSILVAFAYILFYIRGRYYLREGYESFTDKIVLDTSLNSTKPYVTNEDKYGDFEADFIYRNEGGPDPTRDAIMMAKRRFPFDWSQLPPSSSQFQAQQSLFVKDPTTSASVFSKETFQNIDAEKILPPDEYQEDALKAYQAKTASDMKTVDYQSVDNLIHDIYGKKGLIAKVAKKANNVYEVYETMEKNPKIVYEDDYEAQGANKESNALNPLIDSASAFIVPNTVSDIQVGLAPYGAGESMGLKRQIYDSYNPNLEGIFGSKMQMQQWG